MRARPTVYSPFPQPNSRIMGLELWKYSSRQWPFMSNGTSLMTENGYWKTFLNVSISANFCSFPLLILCFWCSFLVVFVCWHGTCGESKSACSHLLMCHAIVKLWCKVNEKAEVVQPPLDILVLINSSVKAIAPPQSRARLQSFHCRRHRHSR